MVMFWRVYKYSFFPTEKNLLVSFWWDFVYFKNRRPGDTLYDFLDERRVFLKRELTGPGQSDFLQLSRRMKDLKTFIKDQFQVTRLPGTFDDLNGFDYKNILKEEKEDQRRVQLKQHFRQISEHPKIFGEAIARRAFDIIDEHYD